MWTLDVRTTERARLRRRHPSRSADLVRGAGDGAVVVFVPHTTAGVTINEDADPSVRADLEMALERMVPSDLPFTHARGQLRRAHQGEPDGQQRHGARRGRRPAAGHLAGHLLRRVRRPAAAPRVRARSCAAERPGGRARRAAHPGDAVSAPEHLLEEMAQRVGVEPAAAVPQQQPLGRQVLALRPERLRASRPASGDANHVHAEVVLQHAGAARPRASRPAGSWRSRSPRPRRPGSSPPGTSTLVAALSRRLYSRRHVVERAGLRVQRGLVGELGRVAPHEVEVVDGGEAHVVVAVVEVQDVAPASARLSSRWSKVKAKRLGDRVVAEVPVLEGEVRAARARSARCARPRAAACRSRPARRAAARTR